MATEDGTELQINPACDMLGGLQQGVPFIIQINQGATYLLKAESLQDISGTTIIGTAANDDCRPFAVFEGYELAAISDGSVQWLNSNQEGLSLLVREPGEYTVQSISNQGCLNKLNIDIVENCPEPTLYAPNSFTPNFDGIYDFWKVEFEGEINSFSVVIFDRNGQEVFSTEDENIVRYGNVRGGTH